MTYSVFLNNQSVRQASLLPNGDDTACTRYIFIGNRNLPVILSDEKSTVSQPYAVGVDDGKNPRYQLGYKDEGIIQITLEEKNGKLQYSATSGYTSMTDLPL